jgi:isopropylmalate/homocitrate/citramalate synthase
MPAITDPSLPSGPLDGIRVVEVGSFIAGPFAGLGGCPFSPGATGNVPTEDVVHLLHLMGHDTGVDLDALLDVGRALEAVVGRRLPGQLLRAGPRTRLTEPSGAPS